MAHFAQLSADNIVLQVIVVNNEVCLDANGVEREELGVAFCKSLLGEDTVWVQTSYNATTRKHYAGVGYTYDPALEAFIPPQPFSSWSLNEATCQWTAPVPAPEDGREYVWDETALSWTAIDEAD